MMLLVCKNTKTDNANDPFYWGVATCAYQVEVHIKRTEKANPNGIF